MTIDNCGQCRPVVEHVVPELDGGRFPIKRSVGERVIVEADCFVDGHDALGCGILYRRDGDSEWREVPMTFLGNDRWRGEFPTETCGRYLYTVQAWVDHFATWRRDFIKRVEAKQDLSVPLHMGADLVQQAAARADGEDAHYLADWATRLGGNAAVAERAEWALHRGLAEAMGRHPDRELASSYDRVLACVVDPVLGRFSAWYELFPRSTSPEPGRHGSFRDTEARLPYIASMGFDVLYLPPIHPIGLTFRKGPNNSLNAGPADPGSPWVIGAPEGGHMSAHPELGTLDDFRRLVTKARELGIAVALDIAFQCSPEHPWVTEHPEWFVQRPDGSIQYAENPPKKYQDIYPLNFESEDWRALWEALRDVFLFWLDQGVDVFRVDNPHTKSMHFWEWVIAEIKRVSPEAIFLSEAFTRPKLMHRLAKAGFTQSYNYFP